ncbi:IPTL-CTERM sorting domain-containing protein [Diaphorobacter limosus]|uniref:IPTL-CTERM sorting domain-containing protein n=1 Tax=Diaphorobacter limosus TaxID=3036128 RepID=A0ABZ0J1A4_9BURK|nr:IPTL-CTERM sorting domain-containing protein [Diaphorobacter sp. Y-1]WOO31813.1 IPTL-CTERM sorting domain-containing protein [Diaphorobacter sp. Y-1]
MKFPPLLALSLGLSAGAAQAVTCQDNIPASNPDSAYTVHGDQTVTDPRTGLMWKQCLEGQSWSGSACTGTVTPMNWVTALSTAEAASFAGHSDWRLPNLKELRSLVEECRTVPSINDTVFPGTPSSDVWSGSPNANGSNSAWYVDFNDGYANSFNRSYSFLVRLVRAGQSLAPLPALSAVALSGTPTGNGAAFVGTSDKTGTGYWLVVPSGSQVPTSAQVKAGVAYGGVTPAAHGSGAMAAGTPASFAASGLSAATGYDFYLVAEAAGQLSAPVQRVAFATATAATLPEGPQTGQPMQVVALPSAGGWHLDAATTQTLASLGAPLPPGLAAPQGVVTLSLSGGTAGTAATVVLTYPQPLPAGTVYYKYGKTAVNPTNHWYSFSSGAAISGNTITLTLTDGADGDDDLAANGSISDPGGPVVPLGAPMGAASIPTLSEWALWLLSALTGLLALAWLRGRKAAGA